MHAELLNTIYMMLQQQGPAASFILDGHNSGISLPPIHRLTQSGYTFYTWMRVDIFGGAASVSTAARSPSFLSSPTTAPARSGERDSSAGLASHRSLHNPASAVKLGGVPTPRLLCLLDEERRGIEAYFDRQLGETACLRLRTYNTPRSSERASKKHTLDFRFRFKPGRWYHIGIVHVQARLFTKSQVGRGEWLGAAVCSGQGLPITHCGLGSLRTRLTAGSAHCGLGSLRTRLTAESAHCGLSSLRTQLTADSAHCPLLAAHPLLPTTCCLLLAACCPPPTIHHPLLTIHHPPPTAQHLSTATYHPPRAHRLLPHLSL